MPSPLRTAPSTTIIAAFAVLLGCLVGGCTSGKPAKPACLQCHRGIEEASPTHRICTSCHGGDPRLTDKNGSHRSMLAPRNPSEPHYWEKTCGACHAYQLGRVRSNLMYTNTGMIRNIQLTWEGDEPNTFSARGGKAFDGKGKPVELKPVAELDNMAGELYRKFCSRCHIGIQNGGVFGSSHASGCAACHFPYNDRGAYAGGDGTMFGRSPNAASHRMSPLPENAACSRCHNRSGRIALSYEGLYDGNNGLVPTKNGLPGPRMISGGRNVTHIAMDIHFAAGMDCIDCHTSRDVMGDGYAYRNMYLQTEIACEDCHGGKTAPRWKEIVRENEEPVRESKSYRVQMRPGMKMILTSKGRPYSNVYYRDGVVYVVGKRSGKLYRSKVITGTPEHAVRGHERMECYACHSRTVVQCYGCHTTYDRGTFGMDAIKGKETPGDFSESEDYRMLYPFPLALNQRAKISPITPGCQTFVTVIEPDGKESKSEYVTRFKGKNQLRFAPFYSHNTGKKAVGCAECHANPAFLGFGQHVVAGNSMEATLLCERSAEKPLDGLLTMQRGEVVSFSAVTREGSRALNGREVKRTLAVNLCIICHDRANDPIYRKELDYSALEDALHRRLLSGRR